MHQILKRLELIKTAISIEEEEIIELQVLKLKDLACDNDVESILLKIEAKDYGSVMEGIEVYLTKYSGVVIYEDKEMQGLRLELKALEKLLQSLVSEKNEYLNDINEFNVQYHLRLGAIIKKILNLKKELLREAMQNKKETFEDLKDEYKTLKKAYKELSSEKKAIEKELEEMDEFDDDYDALYEELQKLKDELNEKEEVLNEKRKETKKAKKEYEEDEVTKEYEEVRRDSEEFSKEYEEVKQEDRFELNDEEKKELKKLFRKASRLCHPDLVGDELREQAHSMMQKLNEAYGKRDLKAVKELLFSLESGQGFDVASDTITDKELLKSKIVDIRDVILQNEKEVEAIKEDEVVEILNEYEDLEDYFSELEEKFYAQYEMLENNKSQNTSKTKKEEDSYWDEEF